MRPLAAALALAALGACGVEAGPGDARNVLLITLDTTRADHLSCYGYGAATTPRIDALAAEGALFERCITTAALTPVAHASILTGLDPQQHGLRVLDAGSGWRLRPEVPTLAGVLGRAGWATAAVLSAFPVSAHFGLQHGFGHFDDGMRAEPLYPDGGEPRRVDGPQADRQRRSDATTDAAVAWLDARAEGPFFLWVHYWDPHDAILLPPDAEARAEELARTLGVSRAAALYDVELAYMDAQLGRLFDALDERGLDDSTLVVLTADHGEGLGEHDWDSHRLLYDEQVHVPLVVRAPGSPAGVRVPTQVRVTDVFPTVLAWTGVAAPRPVAGLDLSALLGGAREPDRLAYAEALIRWDTRAQGLREARPQDDDLLHSVGDGTLKLIYRPLHPEASELYDLARDPDEATNLYAVDDPRAVRLRERLEALDAFALEPLGAGEIDPEAAEALRALGYAGDG